MAVVQTTYPNTHGLYVDGQVANTNTCSVDSRVNQSTASIPFGRAVSRSNQTGAPDNGIEVYEGARFEGIAIMDERVPASSGVAFATGDIVPVLWHGDVAVKVSAAVTNNADVVIATAESGAGTTLEEIGQLSTKAADSTHIALTGAWFLTTTAAQGIAVVRIANATQG